jgi:Gram-negative bacterial TonB protein C-terminal
MKLHILVLFIGFSISLQAQQGDEAFTYVEKMPEYVGGTKAMYKFINHNLQYSDTCVTELNTAYVIVQFMVDTSGYIVNPKVVRGNECGLNKEALRVTNLMNENGPHWNSGMHNHKKVNVMFTLPVKFELGKH